MKRHKMAKFKGKYRQKYITWDAKTTLHFKSNVSTVKYAMKFWGR